MTCYWTGWISVWLWPSCRVCWDRARQSLLPPSKAGWRSHETSSVRRSVRRFLTLSPVRPAGTEAAPGPELTQVFVHRTSALLNKTHGNFHYFILELNVEQARCFLKQLGKPYECMIIAYLYTDKKIADQIHNQTTLAAVAEEANTSSLQYHICIIFHMLCDLYRFCFCAWQ